MNITEDQFRKTMGLFTTGVTVVTAPQKDGGDIGITISSFTSLSLNPPQILFCLSLYSKTLSTFQESRYFAVNILNANQSSLSDGFARRAPIDWKDVKTHRHALSGCLLLSDALGHVICEKGTIYQEGDHDIIIGKVVDVISNPHDFPLLRQRGHYLTTQPLSPEIPLAVSCQKI